MSTTTATPIASFDVIEDRLREIRRSMALADEQATTLAPTTPAPATPAPASRPAVVGAAASTPRAVASTWDVVLLGAAWVGLITLIALAV